MAGQYASAVLRQMMKRQAIGKQELMEKAARSFAGLREGLMSDAESGNIRMTESRIYVGLNDTDTREQKYETEKYVGILKHVCRSYHVAFSMDIEEGGYFHEDGEYTEEVSLVLILIDADRDIVREIAKDLCTFFHQESVLVTENQISGRFISRDS